MNIVHLLCLLALMAATLSACASEREREGTPEEKLFHGFPYNLSTG